MLRVMRELGWPYGWQDGKSVMICPHCGCFFCDDLESGPEPSRGPEMKVYCSHQCKRRATKRRSKTLVQQQKRKVAGRRTSMRFSCPRKQRYESMTEVLTALRWLRDNGNAPPEAHVYECPCGGWHITSHDWDAVAR